MFSTGDTVPLTTFVNFAQGSDVVIHESVGPVWNFSTAGVAGQNILLVSNSITLSVGVTVHMHCTCPSTGLVFLGLSVSKVMVQSLSGCTKFCQYAQTVGKQSEPLPLKLACLQQTWILSRAYCNLQHNQGCVFGMFVLLIWHGLAPSACDISCCRTTPHRRKSEKSLLHSTLHQDLPLQLTSA